MNVTHLRRSDPTVNAMVKAAFPEYRGQKVKAMITDTVILHGTNWDEGSKRDYVALRVADCRAVPIADAPWACPSDLHTTAIPIPPGFVIVALQHFRGEESVEILTPADNISKLLPAPLELSDDEKTVLSMTRQYKSSYAGIKDYRFQQSGMTRARWDDAKSALIAKKLLNKAGALTVEGRNASN